jgi:hypothetical protein
MSADTVVIVPTRGRPAGFERLVRSIWATQSEATDIVGVINLDDLANYEETLDRLRLDLPGGRSGLWVHSAANDLAYRGKINDAAWSLAGDYRFMFIPNDDHEVLTPGWDRAFKDAIGDEPFGLAYGNDSIWVEGQVPTAPFLTTSLHSTLGWTANPELEHILIDNTWLDLARWCGTAHYLPEVMTVHHHLDNGEAEMDATYAETQHNEARNEADRAAYRDWYENRRWIEGDRLRALWDDEASIPPRQFAPWE